MIPGPGPRTLDPIVVSAAVIERDDAFLLTRRLKGTHLEGTWEFPGGKCEPDETPEACLVREIREELAVDAAIGELMLVTRHAYPERTVELHFFRATCGNRAAAGQQMRWVPRAELRRWTPEPMRLIGSCWRGDRTVNAGVPECRARRECCGSAGQLPCRLANG